MGDLTLPEHLQGEMGRSRRRPRPDDDPGSAFKEPLEVRLVEIRQRLGRLQARLRDQCPGRHAYVDHGDGKLPWCDACGFTDTGLYRCELGQGGSKAARRAMARLQVTLQDRCPGEHRYVQHRDGKPRWCESCGLTNIGLHSSHYEAKDHELAGR